MSDRDEKQSASDLATIGMLFDPMEQMRELLFGQTKRDTDRQLRAFESALEELRKEINARFEALEDRLAENAQEAERNQAESLRAIGGAMAELGATIQNMAARQKA